MNTKYTSFIKKVDGIVLENLNELVVTPEFLSREIGLSKMQIHRKIKKATGRSTARYIRFVKLCSAKEYLLGTDWPISQIAFKVGFQDHSYFTKSFVEEFGVNPTAFRKEYIK